VLATTKEGTRQALADARRLTGELDAEVRLLVPRLARAGAPFDASGSERDALIDESLALAAEVGLHATALFCVCDRLDDVAHQLLGRSSLLIVGGRRRVWWPTREELLVGRLSREGYIVVFAQVGAGPAREAALAPAS
jgi:hypothetical protein